MPGTVLLSCETEGATIYYTTDGTDPTRESYVYDANGIPVTEAVTIKAMATAPELKDSIISTFAYEKKTGSSGGGGSGLRQHRQHQLHLRLRQHLNSLQETHRSLTM